MVVLQVLSGMWLQMKAALNAKRANISADTAALVSINDKINDKIN